MRLQKFLLSQGFSHKVEINREREKVEYQLKKEAIDLALELSTKVIEKNIDKEKNKELIDEFITEVGN